MRLKQSILGVDVSVVDRPRTLQFIEESIRKKKRVYICVAAVHLIMECQHDRGLFDGVNRADLVVPDGMPLVWFLNASGYKDVRRVYGPDLTISLCDLAERKKFSVFFLGGEAGQSRRVAQELRHRFPGLSIVGNIDTPARPLSVQVGKEKIDRINAIRPDIVLIGMGCPYQELWMIENREKLKAPVLIGVGAAFDIISGKVPQAPKWMRQAGLEWLFRFAHEPRRLWRRYTLMNIKFLFLLLKSLLLGGQTR